MATLAVLGTFDTKGEELGFIAEAIRRRGHRAVLIDVGTLGPPQVAPDYTRGDVAAAAGIDLEQVVAGRDRGRCVAAMAEAAPKLLARLAAQDQIAGVIALGGGCGTAIGTAAMRALPIGLPKVMVSTGIGGDATPDIGARDIVLFPSVVDVAGLNRISRLLFAQAAGAICGMVEAEPAPAGNGPLVVASMFGNSTECVDAARRILEDAGCEVLVFHANGVGGRAMEALIESGQVAGVLDVTTTEWADELVGGILGAGPTRLDAAARARVPAVVAPGCLDMVNFGEPETVPEKYRGRLLYAHNPQATLMRTTAEECRKLGRILAEKVNRYTAPVTVLLPTGGLSAIGSPGGPFHDPRADRALFESLRQHLDPGVSLIEVDVTINETIFARACAEALIEAMSQWAPRVTS